MKREQSRGMRYWIRHSLYRLVCGIATTAAVVSAGQAQEPAKGGTLVIARPADIFTFDPYNTQDDRSIFTELTLYERLVRLSADGKGVDPELATGMDDRPRRPVRRLQAAQGRDVLRRNAFDGR
jgi:ABC-type dipeptide transport system, periplasmic component